MAKSPALVRSETKLKKLLKEVKATEKRIKVITTKDNKKAAAKAKPAKKTVKKVAKKAAKPVAKKTANKKAAKKPAKK